MDVPNIEESPSQAGGSRYLVNMSLCDGDCRPSWCGGGQKSHGRWLPGGWCMICGGGNMVGAPKLPMASTGAATNGHDQWLIYVYWLTIFSRPPCKTLLSSIFAREVRVLLLTVWRKHLRRSVVSWLAALATST